jgi:hypothetical protein
LPVVRWRGADLSEHGSRILPARQIAERHDADRDVIADHRDVADRALAHQAHGLVDRRRRRQPGDHRLGRDLRDLHVVEVAARERTHHEISIGDDAEQRAVAIRHEHPSDLAFSHDPRDRAHVRVLADTEDLLRHDLVKVMRHEYSS